MGGLSADLSPQLYLDWGLCAAQAFEAYSETVQPVLGDSMGVDPLIATVLATLVLRAVPPLDQATSAWGRLLDKIARRVDHLQIDVGAGILPRDLDGNQARLRSAPFIDETVAVVINGILAAFFAARRAP